MNNDYTPFDPSAAEREEQVRRAFPRSLIAPAMGAAAGLAGLLFDGDDAEAGRRNRHQIRRERQDERDDRQDDRQDRREELREARQEARDGDGPERNDVHHDSWGGEIANGGRSNGQHIRNDFDAWS